VRKSSVFRHTENLLAGIIAEIPTEPRNRIQRMFNRIKQFRRIATRYDKTKISFAAFLAIAAAKIWLPFFVNMT
jgi:hypothetical protein